MLRFMKKRSKKAGLPPGEAVYVGESCPWSPQIQITSFDAVNLEECGASEISGISTYKEKPGINWIDVCGIHRVDIIQKLSEIFQWHALVVEDIVNSDQRIKIEIFDDYIFLVLKMLTFNETARELKKEQVSLIVGSNYVFTFREKESAIMAPLSKRIKNGRGRIRRMGTDYLAYSVIDLIVDYYFEVLEKMGLAVEEIEEELIESPTQETMKNIHALNKEILLFRKTVWPMREISNQLIKGEHDLIQENTLPFLRDLYDHTVQVIETGETFREVINNMLNLYISQMSNRMNEVMKVLTIFAAIFIPLTFMAGIYGMNFENMPELHSKYGYPTLLAAMGFVGGGLLVFFRKKGWL